MGLEDRVGGGGILRRNQEEEKENGESRRYPLDKVNQELLAERSAPWGPIDGVEIVPVRLKQRVTWGVRLGKSQPTTEE